MYLTCINIYGLWNKKTYFRCKINNWNLNEFKKKRMQKNMKCNKQTFYLYLCFNLPLYSPHDKCKSLHLIIKRYYGALESVDLKPRNLSTISIGFRRHKTMVLYNVLWKQRFIWSSPRDLFVSCSPPKGYWLRPLCYLMEPIRQW